MSAATRGFAAAALVALIAAAALHLAVMAGIARLWPAYVGLMIFGWITGMILAVSCHTIPVFSGRSFPSPRIGLVHAGLFAVGLGEMTAALLFARLIVPLVRAGRVAGQSI